MNILENIAGEICKLVFPINEEIFLGNSQSSLAICTLSSLKLLKEISGSSLMSKVAIAGRLLSENNGIDSLVRNVISKKNIETILVCGKDTLGHRPGSSLLKLYENGIDNNGRIVGSTSPDPVLSITKFDVRNFQKQISIINKIGETNISKIKLLVNSQF